MATFSTIRETEAPIRPRTAGRLAERMRRYEQYVTEVGRGKVGRLEPERGESPRGVALRINRAARRIGREVHTWVVDGVVYFKPA